ncbi:transporter substrate-binding domain-containing protein [Synechococcus sp. MIT S9508]|uniref:transporter substrate-binding domain-containing protein n=1 Tax=Synechococcus sp. MIT S9508 TaxID=1801629 RepID=UPI001E41D1C9|nr:transporter substrate-binding domain-containing protein [Synechococcus sp. MIT S9508]
MLATITSAFALCLVAEFIFIPIQADQAFDKDEKTLKIGTVDDFLPCSDYINQTHEGMAIDIWRRIGERLKLKYEISSIPSFDEAVSLAAIGKFDVIASCHEVTPERLELVQYAVPYTSGGIVIVSRQNQRPVFDLIVKIFRNKIVVRCSLLLLLVTAVTAYTSKYFRSSKATRKSKARRFTRAWTFLILNDGIDTVIGPKILDNIAVLISSLSHMLLMSAIIGTTVTIVFEENIAKATKELGNKELESMLKEGIAVLGESSTASWLNNRIAITGIYSEPDLEPITVKTKAEMLDLLRGRSADKPHHFVANITTYSTKLKEAGLEKEFAISYQSPRKTPQSFIFGSNLDDGLKQLINIEIAKMNRNGLTEQLEKDWLN